MESWTETDSARLEEGLRAFDREAVRVSAERFAEVVKARGGSPRLLEQGVEVLRRLHRKRHLELVKWLAEQVLRTGLDHPRIRHRYAMTLLDTDQVAAAEAVLRRMPADVVRADSEVRGAIGRVHKTRYLTGNAPGDLGDAVSWYRSTYLLDPIEHHYHGINAAAMLVRADEDDVRVAGFATPRAEAEQIASAILAWISVLPEPGMWHLATAAEACLLLRRHDEAVRWMSRYVADPAVDAFELNSTLRQFRMVHRLADDAGPGRQILPMLRGRLLRSEGGRVVLAGAGDASLRRLDEVVLEKRFSAEQFRSIAWLRAALTSCRAVARIETRLGDGVGTGFLLDGTALASRLPARVVLTNAHVVPEALEPRDGCFVTFRGNDDAARPARHQIRRVLWTSPVRELDSSLLELATVPDESIAPLRPRRAGPVDAPGRHAYVIGYPNGVQDVLISLHDTWLLDLDDRVAHYRSPTEEGSSGSPVFDGEWQVFAVHHRGSHHLLRLHGQAGTYQANEGIRMDRILSAVGDAFRP